MLIKKTYLIGLCTLLLIVGMVNATSYYVSNTGNDSSTTCNSTNPCQTIAHYNTLTINPGDNIYFNKGDMWRLPTDAYPIMRDGNSTNNVLYDAYGTGNKPEFWGSYNLSNVNNWTYSAVGDCNDTCNITTPYYFLTLQEGTIKRFRYTSLTGNTEWGKSLVLTGDAKADRAFGSMANSSGNYTMSPNITSTNCINNGVMISCSNGNATNNWTFYQTYIKLESTSNQNYRLYYTWTTDYPSPSIHAISNGTDIFQTSEGIKAAMSSTGSVSMNNSQISNNSFLSITWNSSITNNFTYTTNGSISNSEIEIGRGATNTAHIPAGTIMTSYLKVMSLNTSQAGDQQILQPLTSFKADPVYPDDVNVWGTIIPMDLGNILVYGNETSLAMRAPNQTLIAGEFSYNETSNTLKIYATSNPATYFSNIEATAQNQSLQEMAVRFDSKSYITLANWSLKYFASAGLNGENMNHISWLNNDLRYIGGDMQDAYTLRYGNPLDIQEDAHNVTVKYNTVTQCFDDAIVIESYASGGQSNITDIDISYNVVSYCGAGIDYFSSVANSSTSNIYIHHNTMVNLGQDWTYGKTERFSSQYTGRVRIDQTPYNTTNFNFKDNLIYASGHAYVMDFNNHLSNWRNYLFDNNLYYNSSGIGDADIEWNATHYYGLTDFKSHITNQEINSIEADPLFTNASSYNFTPLYYSPVCGAASDGTDIGAIDCEDNNPPTVNITYPTNGTITNISPVNLTYIVTDDHTLITSCTLIKKSYYDDGANLTNNYYVTANNGTISNYTLTVVATKINMSIQINCTDGINNGTSGIIYFIVDTAGVIVNITNPLNGSNTSSNTLNITYFLQHNTTETSNISYYNISLLNGGGSFNATIVGNNSNNLSYLWIGALVGYSPGTYIIRVDAINSTGSVFASGNSSYVVVTNAVLNVTAYGNGTLLSNFTIVITPGNNTVTTSGVVLVGIIKNFTYTVSIVDSGYAVSSVTRNWSNDTNYLIFNLTALANSLFIVFRDQDNHSILVGTNISLDLISGVFANNYSTVTGNLTINNLNISNYSIRYGASGYATRFYSAEVTNQSTQNLTLYMILLSSSSNVTVTVIDQNANPVENAVVKALKYDLATNSYLLQEIGNTNVEGETVLSLTMFDEYYKFMVEYDDELKTITSPAYITSNSLTIQILLGSLVGTDYYHYANIFADLSFNVVTDNFRLDYDDVDGLVDSVCLDVYTLSLLGESFFNDSCSVSASGTLLVSVAPVNGTTYVGRAYYFEGGERIFLDSETYTYPSGEPFGKTYGLLLQLVITVFCAFLAVWSLPLAALLVPLSLVIGRVLHFNFFGWDALVAVLVVGIIIAYVTRKSNG